MPDTITLTHPKHGDAIVDRSVFESDGKDGHGWSKKEAEARGFKVKKDESKGDGK